MNKTVAVRNEIAGASTEEAIHALDRIRGNPENGAVCLNDEERIRPTGSRHRRHHGASKSNKAPAASHLSPSRKHHHRHHKKKKHHHEAEKSSKRDSSSPASNPIEVANGKKKAASVGNDYEGRLRAHPNPRHKHHRQSVNEDPLSRKCHEKEKHHHHQHKKKKIHSETENSPKLALPSKPKDMMAKNEQKRVPFSVGDGYGEKASAAIPKRAHCPCGPFTKEAATAASQVPLSRNHHKTEQSPKNDSSLPASDPKDVATKACDMDEEHEMWSIPAVLRRGHQEHERWSIPVVARRAHHPQSSPKKKAKSATSHVPLSKKTTCGVDDPSPGASKSSTKEVTTVAPHDTSSRNHVTIPDSYIGPVGTEVPGMKKQADKSRRTSLPHSSERVSEKPTRPAAANTTTKRTMIFVPRAQDWYKGKTISDDNGNELFTVVCSEENGSTNTDRPRYQAFVADQDGTDVLAGVTTSGKGGLSSEYLVYTCFPAFDGQKPAKILECTGISDACMYLYGTCIKSLNCAFERFVGETRKKLVLVSKEKRFGMFTSRRLVKFYQPGLREPIISRDQNMQSLSIAAGGNLLLSVCLSYIIDRYSKPFGSRKERRDRDKRNVHGQVQCHLRKAIEGMRIGEDATGQACNAENGEVVGIRVLSPADPARERTTFRLPRAQDWHNGMRIADVNNQVIFTVCSNENFGTRFQPSFQVFITDEDDNHILAAVSQVGDTSRSMWRIYTRFRSYEGQIAVIRLSREDKNDEDMYSYGKLYWRTFKRYIGEHEKEVVFSKTEVTRYKSFQSPRLIKFYKAHQSDPVLSRDQREESLIVAPGENLLVALCLSYAIDRQIKDLGSREERNARPMPSTVGDQFGSEVGEQTFGLVGKAVGTFVGAAIDSTIDNARDSKARERFQEVTISQLE